MVIMDIDSIILEDHFLRQIKILDLDQYIDYSKSIEMLLKKEELLEVLRQEGI